MTDKPTTATGYRQTDTLRVIQTCLTVATHLGDLLDDLIIVGGLVPTLLIDQNALSLDQRHVGTVDLDVGLTLALLDEQRYLELSSRLRRANFTRDQNPDGNPTNQRWIIFGQQDAACVDFLIPPSRPDDRPGTVRNIESDWAAIITPGLHLAFADRVSVPLEGVTLDGEHASRDIGVCGPGAYIILKALACDGRYERKDAYDLDYLLNHYRQPEAVANHLRPLLSDPDAQKAIGILRRDFLGIDSPGPVRVAQFLTGARSVDIQVDVVQRIRQLLQLVDVL